MRISMWIVLIICFAASFSSAYAAIGIYKASVGPTIPMPISYMLNRDADSTIDGWALKIEIESINMPTYGQTIKTWTFPAGDPWCNRGMHQNALVWNGLKEDGTPAPPGNYAVHLTAKAAPVTGSAIKPIWESTNITSTGWKDAAVNTNPNSPYYGYIYAVNASTKEVYYWLPDGTPAGTFSAKPQDGWLGSTPWGVDVDDAGNVYVVSRSNSNVYIFPPDGSGFDTISIGAYKNPRFFAVTGSRQNTRIVATTWNPNDIPPTSAKLFTLEGDPLASLFNEIILSAPCPLMEPEFDSAGMIHVPAYAGVGSISGGALTKYDMTGTLLARNDGIRRGTGLAISPDGSCIWIARYVNNADATGKAADVDEAAIYKVATSMAYTDANPNTGIGVEKLAIANTGTYKRAYTLECDAFGNLATAAGNNAPVYTGGADCSVVGLYEPPDSGSVCTVTVQSSPCPAPRIIDVTADPSEVCAGDPNRVVTITALVEDNCGDTGITCRFSSPGLQIPIIPMNRVSSSESLKTYQLQITIPSSTQAGEYTGEVCIYDDSHPTLPVDCRDVVIKVVNCTTSLGAAKALPDSLVRIDCANAPLVVTDVESVQPGMGQKWFYVEASDRSAGIKVEADSLALPYIWPGYKVSMLSGALVQTDKDRILRLSQVPSFTPGTPDDVPAPLAMANVTLGGTPTVDDRGAGLNTEGLLVKVWGRVKKITTDPVNGAHIIFIDDGSAVESALPGTPPVPAQGLKCREGEVPVPVVITEGDYVVLTGISSSEWVSEISSRIRVIKMRHCEDITQVNLPLSDEIQVVVDRNQ